MPLDHGCVVCGSSSIGALRAAELHAYGMHGIGLCYRLYRAGVITDDDEVAVFHGDATTNYAHFSEPLVNARLTLRKLRRNAFLCPDRNRRRLSGFKALHFSLRTFPEYKRILVSAFGADEGNRIQMLFQSHYRDLKREDASQLMRYVLCSTAARPGSAVFLRTSSWRHQFEEFESELKPLQ